MEVVIISINLDYKKSKVKASYKSLYIRNDLIEQVEEIAKKNNTSFNNIIVNMIEYCVKENNTP